MAMKKIICIHGAPRKNGNTRAVTAVALEAARKQGAMVAEIDTIELKFKVAGCIGCQKCQNTKEFMCTIGDELGKTVATLPEYDVILFSTPLYWWSYSAQLKIFIDRMYSLGKFNDESGYSMALAGKTIALIATGGGDIKDNLEILESQLRNPAAMMECTFRSCLFPNVRVPAGELTKNPAAVSKAQEFGKFIAV
jgi:multimeric flavodoxin WrbA